MGTRRIAVQPRTGQLHIVGLFQQAAMVACVPAGNMLWFVATFRHRFPFVGMSMTATHVAMTTLIERMTLQNTSQIRESYERSSTRLSRTYLAQMDAFKKYRSKSQQTVRVERVNVESGGQAVVGDVSHGGRVEGEK